MDKTSRANATSPAEIRAELDRILNSPSFRSAHRLKGLLEFLGDRHLKALPPPKEFEIATEVFERDESFDPATDSLVRVHTSRLRQKLKDFYALEKRLDTIEIRLAKSAYQLEILPVELPIAQAPEAGNPEDGQQNTPTEKKRNTAAVLGLSLAAAVVLAAGVVIYFSTRSPYRNLEVPVRVSRLGAVAGNAKFSQDGRKIFYHAQALDGREFTLHSADLHAPAKSTELGYNGLRLYSISQAGFLLLDAKSRLLLISEIGTPAKVIAQNIHTARWDGRGNNARLLVVRGDESTNSRILEYPLGKELARQTGNIGNPFQFAMPSRDGRWIAYGRPSGKSTDYDLWVLDTQSGAAKVLVPGWSEFGPVSFTASGQIVLGGIRRGEEPRLYRVDPATGRSEVVKVCSQLTIVEDIWDDDSMLVREIVRTKEIHARLPGQTVDQQLRLGGEFIAASISPDGKQLILSEFLSGDSDNQRLYLYDSTKAAKPTYIGLGTTASISYDERLLLTSRIVEGRGRAIAIDLETLTEKEIGLPQFSYRYPQWSKWSNDQFLFWVTQAGGTPEIYVQDLNPPALVKVDSGRAAFLKPTALALQRGPSLFRLSLPQGTETLVSRDALAGLDLTIHMIPPATLIAVDSSSLRKFYAIDSSTGVKREWKRFGSGIVGDPIAPNGVFSRSGEYYAFTIQRDSRSLFLLRNR